MVSLYSKGYTDYDNDKSNNNSTVTPVMLIQKTLILMPFITAIKLIVRIIITTIRAGRVEVRANM